MDLFTRSLDAGPDEVLIQLHPSLFRRRLGALALLAMSAYIFNQGLVSESQDGDRLMLLLIGALGFYAVYLFWKLTANGLELTPTEFREINGRRIIALADIAAIDREAFGPMKPANGFVIVGRTGGPLTFRPGLWWRLGNRIGIGGLLPAGVTKASAELLQKMVERQNLDETDSTD